MQQYKDLVQYVKENGRYKMDRTGTGVYSVFGAQMRFDLSEGFPILTLKNTQLYRIANELLWFLSGSTDESRLSRMDRIHREALKHHRAIRAHIHASHVDGLDGELFLNALRGNLGESAYGDLMPGVGDLEENVTVGDVERMIESALYYGEYTWTYELEPRPTIWDEWATFNPVFCREQLNWVIDRTEGDSEVKEAAGIISAKFENWDGADTERNKWFQEAVVSLSEKYHVGISDVVEERTIGPMYGKQWRAYGDLSIDQLDIAIKTLKADPTSRRICITAWDPEYLPDPQMSPLENVVNGNMALAPCHAFFQFYADEITDTDLLKADPRKLWQGTPKYRLSCQVYCRSQDLFLGTPYNIASYALLVEMVASACNMLVGDLVWTGGDVHLYSNHMEQVDELLSREPRPLPKLLIDPTLQPWNTLMGGGFKAGDFTLEGYNPHPSIVAPVAI